MSVTTVVKAATFDADVKSALKQFILNFFDGQSHMVGFAPVTFPVVSVEFGRRRIARPLTQPLVTLAPLGQGRQTIFGRNIRRSMTWQILVIDSSKTERVSDQVSSLLALIFTSCRHYLAASGLRTISVSSPLNIDDYNHEYFVTQRTVTLRVDLEPGIGGESSNYVAVTGEVV